MYDFAARWYDAATASFASVDPLVSDLASPPTHNGYSYVGNQPMAFTDPTGMNATSGPAFHLAGFSFSLSLNLDLQIPNLGNAGGDGDPTAAAASLTAREQANRTRQGNWWGDGPMEVSVGTSTPVLALGSSFEGPAAASGSVAMASVGGLVRFAAIAVTLAVNAVKRVARATRGRSAATKIGSKIESQIAKRGWTQESVEEAIRNPARKVATRDTRHLASGGRANDPATAYVTKDGSYVVRNDVTGDIVQVSDRTSSSWLPPF
jgi:hypothetical protein